MAVRMIKVIQEFPEPGRINKEYINEKYGRQRQEENKEVYCQYADGEQYAFCNVHLLLLKGKGARSLQVRSLWQDFLPPCYDSSCRFKRTLSDF